MCYNNTKIISQIKEGSLILCECGLYTFSYNNLLFEFSKRELQGFKNYLSKISISEWEKKCNCSENCRKISIPTNQGNLLLVFNISEFENMKTLFFPKGNKKNIFLKFNQISEEFSKN
ncbi:MAG: hypothetical protein P8M03_04535 [Flavobacteriaceae bacterium]|nr:hypothetical protein [Flavobacteriaceae bacterium]